MLLLEKLDCVENEVIDDLIENCQECVIAKFKQHKIVIMETVSSGNFDLAKKYVEHISKAVTFFNGAIQNKVSIDELTEKVKSTKSKIEETIKKAKDDAKSE